MEPKICSYCGEALPEGVTVCPTCGQLVQQPVGQPVRQPIGQPQAGAYRDRSNGNGTTVTVLIAALVVLVIGLLVAVFLLLGRSGKDTENNANASSPTTESVVDSTEEAQASSEDNVTNGPQRLSANTNLSRADLKQTLDATSWQPVRVGGATLSMPTCFTIDKQESGYVTMSCGSVGLEYMFFEYEDLSLSDLIYQSKQALSEVTYERQKDNWWVVSGYDYSDMGVYERMCDVGNGFVSFTLHFSRQDVDAIGDFTTVLSRSFK